MNLINKPLFYIFFLFAILFPRGTLYNAVSDYIHMLAISSSNSISIGYDSNPLRLSNNEINELIDKPYLLGNASSVHSRFVQYNIGIKFLSSKGLLPKLFNNRKTIFNLKFSDKTHFENKSKSAYNISFKIDQQLGAYRHLYIDYFLMPSYYLREYEDLDFVIDTDDVYYEAYQSCRFDIEKISFAYQSPLQDRKSKIKFGLSYEEQLFDKYFTEFDLNILGLFGQVNFGDDKNRLMLYYSYENADNFRYLDDTFSTANINRSYIQSRIKFSLMELLNSNESCGFIIDSYYRDNRSTIFSDELHYHRSHNDITFSLWYKTGKHKITFSNRRRTTVSPREWVNELKTFKRYNLTYTIALDKIKL